MGLEAIEKEQIGDVRCLDAYRAVTDTKESSVNYRKSPIVQRDFHGDTKKFSCTQLNESFSTEFETSVLSCVVKYGTAKITR